MTDDAVKAAIDALRCCPEAVSNLPALGHAALAMIARLEAELKAARAALRDIAEDHIPWRTVADMKERARQALEGKEQP